MLILRFFLICMIKMVASGICDNQVKQAGINRAKIPQLPSEHSDLELSEVETIEHLSQNRIK